MLLRANRQQVDEPGRAEPSGSLVVARRRLLPFSARPAAVATVAAAAAANGGAQLAANSNYASA
jgi:hypothetical protein